jgi:hypothetical protein
MFISRAPFGPDPASEKTPYTEHRVRNEVPEEMYHRVYPIFFPRVCSQTVNHIDTHDETHKIPESKTNEAAMVPNRSKLSTRREYPQPSKSPLLLLLLLLLSQQPSKSRTITEINDPLPPFPHHDHPPSYEDVPALVDDRSDARRESSHDFPITPKHEYGFDPQSEPRCTHCRHTLPWVFVDECREGMHILHKCRAGCGCGESQKVEAVKPVERLWLDGELYVSQVEDY